MNISHLRPKHNPKSIYVKTWPHSRNLYLHLSLIQTVEDDSSSVGQSKSHRSSHVCLKSVVDRTAEFRHNRRPTDRWSVWEQKSHDSIWLAGTAQRGSNTGLTQKHQRFKKANKNKQTDPPPPNWDQQGVRDVSESLNVSTSYCDRKLFQDQRRIDVTSTQQLNSSTINMKTVIKI